MGMCLLRLRLRTNEKVRCTHKINLREHVYKQTSQSKSKSRESFHVIATNNKQKKEQIMDHNNISNRNPNTQSNIFTMTNNNNRMVRSSRIVVLLATILHVLGLAEIVTASTSISKPSLRSSLRGRRFDNRQLSFLEQGNLFDHKIACDCSTNSNGESDSGTACDCSKDSGIGGNKNNDQQQKTISSISSSDDNNPTPYPEWGTGVLNAYLDNDGDNDGDLDNDPFSITIKTNASSESSNNISPNDGDVADAIASSYAKRSSSLGEEEDKTTDDEDTIAIPMRDIYIFAALASLCILLYLIYWRDSVIQERKMAAKKSKRKMSFLKNLYADMDKNKDSSWRSRSRSRSRRSSRSLGDCTKSLTPENSPPPSAFSCKKIVDDALDSDLELDDIELDYESSLSSLEAVRPGLSIRAIRRTSGTGEHWIKYSTDEFEIEAEAGENDDSKDDDSIPAL